MVYAALKNTATMSMCTDDDAVLPNGIEDELDGLVHISHINSNRPISLVHLRESND